MSEAGTVKPALVDFNTRVDALVEAALNEAVQTPPLPGASDTGEQTSRESVDGAVESPIVTETVDWPTLTLTVAFWPVAIAPVLIEKPAEVAPAATVTELGTVRAVALSDTETCVPP